MAHRSIFAAKGQSLVCSQRARNLTVIDQTRRDRPHLSGMGRMLLVGMMGDQGTGLPPRQYSQKKTDDGEQGLHREAPLASASWAVGLAVARPYPARPYPVCCALAAGLNGPPVRRRTPTRDRANPPQQLLVHPQQPRRWADQGGVHRPVTL